MSSPDGGDHILVIDDDPTFCRLLSDVLKDAGYVVAIATDGVEALASIEERVPGLLILDMRMSGMDGPELVVAMRERGILIPLIVSTGAPTGVAWAKEIGAVYLEKPFDLDRLVELVKQKWPTGMGGHR